MWHCPIYIVTSSSSISSTRKRMPDTQWTNFFFSLSGRGPSCGFFEHVYNFTVLILRKPEWARFVKSFTLSKEACPHSYFSRKSTHNSIKSHIMQTRWAQAVSSRWLDRTKESVSMQDLLALLLPSFPQLERLDFISSRSVQCDIMPANIGDPNFKLPQTAFKHLQYLIAPDFDYTRYRTGLHPIQGASGHTS